MHNLIVSEDKMNEDEIRKEKIRNLLTPDVIVCKSCREKYKAETSCAVCGVNMLDPEYKDGIRMPGMRQALLRGMLEQGRA